MENRPSENYKSNKLMLPTYLFKGFSSDKINFTK